MNLCLLRIVAYVAIACMSRVSASDNMSGLLRMMELAMPCRPIKMLSMIVEMNAKYVMYVTYVAYVLYVMERGAITQCRHRRYRQVSTERAAGFSTSEAYPRASIAVHG